MKNKLFLSILLAILITSCGETPQMIEVKKENLATYKLKALGKPNVIVREESGWFAVGDTLALENKYWVIIFKH